MPKYNVKVTTSTVEVEADDVEDALAQVENSVSATMTKESAQELYDEVVTRLEPSYQLIYVAYDDQLTDEQVSWLVSDDYEKLWESLEEFESESRWYGVKYVLDDILEGDERDVLETAVGSEWFNGDGTSVGQDTLLDRLRSEIEERDEGDYVKDLARNTRDPLLRIVAIDEDTANEEATPEELLNEFGIPVTPENVQTIQDTVDNCCTQVPMGYFMATVDLESLMKIDGDVVLVNPYIFIGNSFSGAGYISDDPLIGEVTVRKEDLRTDKSAFGYPTSEIYGQTMNCPVEIRAAKEAE